MYTESVSIIYPDRGGLVGGIIFGFFAGLFLVPTEKSARRMMNRELFVYYLGVGLTCATGLVLFVLFFYLMPEP